MKPMPWYGRSCLEDFVLALFNSINMLTIINCINVCIVRNTDSFDSLSHRFLALRLVSFVSYTY